MFFYGVLGLLPCLALFDTQHALSTALEFGIRMLRRLYYGRNVSVHFETSRKNAELLEDGAQAYVMFTTSIYALIMYSRMIVLAYSASSGPTFADCAAWI